MRDEQEPMSLTAVVAMAFEAIGIAERRYHKDNPWPEEADRLREIRSLLERQSFTLHRDEAKAESDRQTIAQLERERDEAMRLGFEIAVDAADICQEIDCPHNDMYGPHNNWTDARRELEAAINGECLVSGATMTCSVGTYGCTVKHTSHPKDPGQ